MSCENHFWNANILYDDEITIPCYPCTNVLTLFCIFNILISDLKATQARIKVVGRKRASIEKYWQCDFKISSFNCLQFLFINTLLGSGSVPTKNRTLGVCGVTFQWGRRAGRGKLPELARNCFPPLLNVIYKVSLYLQFTLLFSSKLS